MYDACGGEGVRPVEVRGCNVCGGGGGGDSR